MMRKQLTFAYIYMFLFSLRFSEVYWVIFLREKGLSFAAIGLLETIFHISSPSGELPTGLLADKKGRKVSLAAGRLISAASSFLMLSAHSWPVLAIAFVFNALSCTFHSGAFEALLYDSLSEDQRVKFTQLLGSINSVYLGGTALTGALASSMARFSLDWLYIASMAVDLMAAMICCFLQEPRGVHTEPADGKHLTFSDAFSRILKQKDLLMLFLFWALASSLATSARFLGQSFLQENGISLSFIGFAGALANLLAIIPARYSYRLQARFGNLGSLLTAGFSIPVLVLLMTSAPRQMSFTVKSLMCVWYLGLTIAIETAYPILSDAVNLRIDSAYRATVLSSGNMMFSLAMMGLFPAMGFLGDQMGLSGGMALMSIIICLAMIPVAYVIRLHSAHT